MHRNDRNRRRSGSILSKFQRAIDGRKRRFVPMFQDCESRTLLSIFTVNVNNDLASPAQPGDISLRMAITMSNENPALAGNVILFNLPIGQRTIQLNSPLPELTTETVIDGHDYVTLDGSAISPVQGTTYDGIVLNAKDGGYIHGITITGFSGTGIVLEGAEHSSIAVSPTRRS